MMRRTLALALLAALAGAVCLAGAASADEKKALTPQQFVTKATACGLAEVNLSRLAVDRASSPEVKKFAQRVIDEHTKANKELLAAADKQRLTAARTMDKAHQEEADKLAKLTGADFDWQYMQQMLKDHKEAVALFEQESKTGQDATLKAWAAKTLPTLQEHLKLTQEWVDKNKK